MTNLPLKDFGRAWKRAVDFEKGRLDNTSAAVTPCGTSRSARGG
jgi:hypothetical protein